MTVNMFVLLPDGRTITLEVDFSDSMAMVKNQIQEKEGYPIRTQRIVFAGRVLEDGCNFRRFAIQKESTLQLKLLEHSLRPRPSLRVFGYPWKQTPRKAKRKGERPQQRSEPMRANKRRALHS